MGGGLAFLTKKSFNPANWSNQRQVWEARQKHATEQRRITEREAQLKRERDEEELARLTGGEEEGGRKALGFMYEGGRIPGLKREERKEYDDDEGNGVAAVKSDSLYERQPGDDDAAAAFRAMLARGTVEDSAPALSHATDLESTPVEERAETEHKDHRTNLEKAVGRGILSGSGVTLTQQMERFPMLKNAPMVLQKPKEEGESSEVAGLNFKPLGQVLRNVKCLSCGKWGHSRGDRECEVSGWDPFRMSAPAMAAVDKPAANAAASSSKQAEVPMGSTEAEEHKSDRHKRKKEKRRHKEDRHKKKRKHKRRRRSPSYSSDSSSSYDSRDRRKRHDLSDDNSREERDHRKESRHRRKHKRRRERSRSISVDSRQNRHRDGGRERGDWES
jgi:hypothetical protein